MRANNQVGVKAATQEQAPVKRSGLTTNELYERLKSMAVLYKIKPGDRVNEVELAQEFQVSRTPVREVLNRLVAENLLTFRPNRGFYVRELETKEIFDLYELRKSIEMAAVELAVERASDAEIDALGAYWDDVMAHDTEKTAKEAVLQDQEFHARLAALSGNAEMVRALNGIDARIHFVRWIDIEARRGVVFDEHRVIVQALRDRDMERCRNVVGGHIAKRMEEVTAVIRASVMKLYVR